MGPGTKSRQPQQASMYSLRLPSATVTACKQYRRSTGLAVARPRVNPLEKVTMAAASPEKIAQNIKPDAEKQVTLATFAAAEGPGGCNGTACCINRP